MSVVLTHREIAALRLHWLAGVAGFEPEIGAEYPFDIHKEFLKMSARDVPGDGLASRSLWFVPARPTGAAIVPSIAKSVTAPVAHATLMPESYSCRS
jgi:hypothetical protein